MTTNQDPPLTRREIAAGAPELLSLPIRRVLYLVGLAALVVAPVVTVHAADYGNAIAAAGNLLGAVALGTALAHPTR